MASLIFLSTLKSIIYRKSDSYILCELPVSYERILGLSDDYCYIVCESGSDYFKYMCFELDYLFE